jgi:curved DNA-binding protein CbpA
VSDPYKTLQVDSEAEFEVIEAAYRRLARKYHPDLSDTPETRERMVAINRAWDELRTPERRAKVDRARARDAAAQAPAQSPSAPRPPRPSPLHSHATASAPAPGDGSLRAAAQPRAGESLLSNQRGTPVGHERAGSRVTSADTWAGPPPGNASGSVLTFGRYRGWSLGEVARHDPSYLEWLERSPTGRPFRPEIDVILRAHRLRGQT